MIVTLLEEFNYIDTRIFIDPLSVALTLSKSELMHRRKWSEGFRKAGQGKPACAKNCIYAPRSHLKIPPRNQCVIE